MDKELAGRVAGVLAGLSNIASQGRYNMTPREAAVMNELFQTAAAIINELEAISGEETDLPEIIEGEE